MAEYEYKISIENLVSLSGSADSKYYNYTTSFGGKMPQSQNDKLNEATGEDKKQDDPFDAMILVGAAKKLAGSVNNPTLQSITTGILPTLKVGKMVYGAIDGKTTSIVALITTLLAQVIQLAQSIATKEASEKNSVDDSRYSAGVLDLNGVYVTKNWWSGRYEYSRKR